MYNKEGENGSEEEDTVRMLLKGTIDLGFDMGDDLQLEHN